MTDSGTQFKSQEFKEFLECHGTHHILTPPYHPASNGLAERAVQAVKNTFLKQILQYSKHNTNRTLQHRIDSFLSSYRNTPHSITGLTSAETLFKFKPKTPHLANQMDIKLEDIPRTAYFYRDKPRRFQVKTVLQEKINWHPGTVIKVLGQVTYLVKVENRLSLCRSSSHKHCSIRGR